MGSRCSGGWHGFRSVLAHEQTWSYEGDRMRAFLDGRVIGRLATRFIAVSELDAEPDDQRGARARGQGARDAERLRSELARHGH